MNTMIHDIIHEVKSLVGGKTIGVIIPPAVYVIVNSFFGLTWAVAAAVLTALSIGLRRYLKGETIKYAAGGLLGVLIASSFAYLAGNAANYFIPKIITSGFLFVVALLSLAFGRPMAAWGSHIARGWEMEWFLRKDVKPAYVEVTLMWAILFLFRMYLQIALYRGGNLFMIVWANTLLGFPATLSVLIISYIYGVWRLRKLGGPGIDEFRHKKAPPYVGQTKGF